MIVATIMPLLRALGKSGLSKAILLGITIPHDYAKNLSEEDAFLWLEDVLTADRKPAAAKRPVAAKKPAAAAAKPKAAAPV